MENEKLATELLHEIKASAKRWFIAFIVMLAIELLTVGMFIWYISLPVEEVSAVEVQNDDGNANYIGEDMNGEIYNGENNSNENGTESDPQ